MSESLPAYAIAAVVGIGELVVIGSMVRRKLQGKPLGTKDEKPGRGGTIDD